MDENEKIKQELKQLIKDNPESFPFIAQYWEIELIDKNSTAPKYLEFGKYNSKLPNSTPFINQLANLLIYLISKKNNGNYLRQTFCKLHTSCWSKQSHYLRFATQYFCTSTSLAR
jgi:hypothetical protein